MKAQILFTTTLVVAFSAMSDDLASTNPPALWQRDALTGDWGGARTKLAGNGIDFSATYTGEVLGNVAGGRYGTGAAYDHSLNLPLSVDLEKLAGWNGATFHANAFWIAGESLSEKCVGDIGNASNIAADRAVRLQEIWLQQEFWQAQLSLRAGQLAADNEFFTADSAALFINGSFGAFPLISANLPNPPIYPMAAPAIRLRLRPDPKFYFQAALFDGDSRSQSDNASGTDFPIATGDGTLFFFEAGFQPYADATNVPVLSLKAGLFVHTKRTPTWNEQITGDPGGGAANFGFYGVAERELFQRADQKISTFLRGGYAPADRNAVDWYLDAGFNFTGFVPGRPHDVAGLAVARSNFSRDYSRYENSLSGSTVHDSEIVVEGTYRAQLAPWWTLQPDLQFIITPGGDNSCQNALVIGLRTSLVF